MSKRTELKKAKMPRWIWQLRLKGFHTQLKKYVRFLWQQRPDGCNWSRELRARYFNRSVSTIRDWDAFLLKWHLAWVSGKGTMDHRIGARPYYSRDVWLVKSGLKSPPKARAANCLPYTAQQKKPTRKVSSSAGAAAKRQQQQPVSEPSADANSPPANTNRRPEIRNGRLRKENLPANGLPAQPAYEAGKQFAHTPEGFAAWLGFELRAGDAYYMHLHRDRFKHFKDWGEDDEMALIMLLAEKDLEEMQGRPEK